MQYVEDSPAATAAFVSWAHTVPLEEQEMQTSNLMWIWTSKTFFDGGLTIVNWAQILSNPTGKFSDLENISALVQKDGILLADLESLRLEDLRNLFEMVENYIQNRIASLDRLSKKH